MKERVVSRSRFKKDKNTEREDASTMNTTALTYDYDNLIKRSTQQLSVMLTLDIYDWYREMQKSHAVYFDEARASWLVFRYDDVQRLLLDPLYR